MLQEELLKKRDDKVLINGTGDKAIPLANLTESILTNEKLDALLAKEIPEIELPEYPSEMAISNLPEVQKVEITNLPNEKDDKEQLALLKEISLELKKKEQYAYDIKIDATLKEQLRGENGIDGLDGKDGVEITPEELVKKLESLKGDARLDVKAIKGLEDIIKNVKETRNVVGGVRALRYLVDVNIQSPTDGQVLSYNATNQNWEPRTSSGGGGSGDVVGPVSATNNAIPRFDLTTGKLIKDSGIIIADGAVGTLSGDNSGDQLMFGTIAVAGQADLDPVGTGDTLTFVAGTNVTLTTNALTKELTINATVVNEDSFGIVVEGAGTAITTGSKGTRYIPYNCTITGWSIQGTPSGSCVFDVKRSGTSIAGSEKPTLSGATTNEDLSLSTWTTSLTAGDVIEFVVDSASTVTRATVTILVSKI